MLLNLDWKPLLSLSRMFPREVEEPTGSHSNVYGDSAAPTAVDPWRVVIHIATTNEQGLSRSLQWLSAFARSGVEIPVAVFMRFSALVTQYDAGLAESLLLVRSVMSATWLRSMGRTQLQSLFSELHTRLVARITQYLESGIEVKDRYVRSQLVAQVLLIQKSLSIIQLSLGTCLLLYGCDRSKITDLGLIKEEDVNGLPSRFVILKNLYPG